MCPSTSRSDRTASTSGRANSQVRVVDSSPVATLIAEIPSRDMCTFRREPARLSNRSASSGTLPERYTTTRCPGTACAVARVSGKDDITTKATSNIKRFSMKEPRARRGLGSDTSSIDCWPCLKAGHRPRDSAQVRVHSADRPHAGPSAAGFFPGRIIQAEAWDFGGKIISIDKDHASRGGIAHGRSYIGTTDRFLPFHVHVAEDR
jgi:hypothetical protein